MRDPVEAFDTLMQRLRDEEDVPSGEWDPLSALADERFTTFRALWDRMPASRRLELLDTLYDEAVEHAHLDFTPIWRPLRHRTSARNAAPREGS